MIVRHWWALLGLLALVANVAFLSPVHAEMRASPTTVNQQLAQELADHRAYADGDPGNYGYAKFIHQVRVTGHRRIMVRVSRRFCCLSAGDKTSVMNQVQALARMVLVNNHWIDKKNSARGLTVTVRCRGQVVGYSRPHNSYCYKW